MTITMTMAMTITYDYNYDYDYNYNYGYDYKILIVCNPRVLHLTSYVIRHILQIKQVNKDNVTKITALYCAARNRR